MGRGVKKKLFGVKTEYAKYGGNERLYDGRSRILLRVGGWKA